MEDIIREQYKKIPGVLKEYIDDPMLDAHIDEIMNEHPLQQVQKDAFGVEIMLVLLQLESVEEFTVNIKHGMEIAMKRAEDISKRTKQLIFAPLQDFLIQRAVVEGESVEGGITDGVVSRSALPQKSEIASKGTIHHSTPEPRHEELVLEQTSETPAQTQTPPAKEVVLQTPVVSGADDIFKKRLEESVHTPTKESNVDENGKPIANENPSSPEKIANDPYKESIE